MPIIGKSFVVAWLCSSNKKAKKVSSKLCISMKFSIRLQSSALLSFYTTKYYDSGCGVLIKITKKGINSKSISDHPYILSAQMCCGVNGSSFFKWLLLQKCVKINQTTFFSLKLFPVISVGPQKYKHKQVITSLLFNIQKSSRHFLIIEIRVIFAVNNILKF